MVVLLLLNVDSLLIVTPIVGVSNCSMFCCIILYVHSRFATILKGKRELVVLRSLSSWCLVIVLWLFLAVPQVCLQLVIVVLTLSYSLTIFDKIPGLVWILTVQ